MGNVQVYFTQEERQQLLPLVRALNDRLGDQLTGHHISTVHDLIERGITEAGIFRRDQFELDPVLHHLNTAFTLCDNIAPDCTMVITTIIYNLCRGHYLDVARVKKLFYEDIARVVHGLLNVAPLYKKQADKAHI